MNLELPSREPEGYKIVAGAPDSTAPDRDGDELFARREAIAHRRCFGARGKRASPRLASSLHIDGVKRPIDRRADEEDAPSDEPAGIPSTSISSSSCAGPAGLQRGVFQGRSWRSGVCVPPRTQQPDDDGPPEGGHYVRQKGGPDDPPLTTDNSQLTTDNYFSIACGRVRRPFSPPSLHVSPGAAPGSPCRSIHPQQ